MVSAMGAGKTDLQDAIGARPPAELDALPEDQRAALAGLVESAAARRATLMDQAIEESLRHLPFVLRATVRRTLGV
jgi:hypothetical protein